MPVKVYIVDAFVKENGGGSPTGVVLDANGLSEKEMMLITKQVPASHTAFVFEPEHENENVGVRFFTVNGEIKNCGHGTIAAHYVRAKKSGKRLSQKFFQQAKEGIQEIEIVREENDLEVYLKQNEIKFSSVSHQTIQYLLQASSLSFNDLNQEFPIIRASPGSHRFLVCINSAEILKRVSPDFNLLKKICNESETMGCFLYCIEMLEPVFEATARMFAPSIGVNEDVINGNSSGCLGVYLFNLKNKNPLNLLVHQGQAFNRQGTVKVHVKNVKGNLETVVGGAAKITEEITVACEGKHHASASSEVIQ